ncbi:Na(+)/H(+) exchange regulatory cofactor NHE-RF1 isoform X2 [Sarcophilus harrisii]|uniref:Na(+)/H(+) exchange regulatory cofactor NHE-RF n=1 Tax=Sarcophilus harrisii TaxID=9305 RepID=A0A7N4PIR2_SARHA|nr:Na(+)/H(+) exchange regulatory cofactor NHE-RF1 isoform X2 [Sarcophilus harrisii]
MSADGDSGSPLPRLCNLEKGPNGYGFHLHGEKGKVGQFIRLVEPGSPAEKAGLLAGDRLVEVNGENVEQESHQQVVSRIRAALNSVRLLVVDPETDERLQKLGIQVREELLRGEAEPSPQRAAEKQEDGGEKQEDGGEQQPPAAAEEPREEKSQPEQRELRPRLCVMKKGPNGYGFNLHSDKSKPGQYIRAVDSNSPAEASGLQAQDRIVEVNGVCMEGKQHGDVVAAIKAGGDETKLLVVDKKTDEFFKKCKVIPSQEHLSGPLPEPVANGEVEKMDSQDKQDSTPPSSTSSSSDPILDFNISLAVAKERAHQKRSSKRAPQMDWSKKNELFSNL